MKILRYLAVFMLLFVSGNLFAQLVISPNPSPQNAVQDVLVGQGVSVSNISYSGAGVAWGTFSTGANATNLGFSEGILLTTGKASDVANNVTYHASTANNTSGDPQLQSLVGATINDAAVLEFDFVPISDTLEFRYVFASEEYPNFANSAYNDVFGFFVSGPNPSGGNYTNRNIAIVPGTTSTPVSINNINNGTTNSGPCMNCQYYVNNQAVSNPYIAYNGMTIVLTAILAVVPCETYHIKLAIGDVGDRIYDSGVFLEANSFSSMGMSYDLNFESDIIANTIISGCSDASLVFRLPDTYEDTVTIYYSFAGNPNEGTDFLVFPADSALIVPGEDSTVVQIIALPNQTFEGVDTIYCIIPGFGCSGILDTLKIPIHGNPPIDLIMSEDQLLCDGGVGYLTTNVSGGIQPYTYEWSNGIGNFPQQDVVPPVSTVYSVTVSDPCGNYAIDSVRVGVGSLMYTMSNDTAICSGKAVSLQADFDGLIYWDGYEGNPILVTPNSTTKYNLIMNNECGTVYDSVEVVVHRQPKLAPIVGQELCDNEIVTLDVGGSYEVVEWRKDGVPFSSSPSIVIDSLAGSGNYFVYVANEFCTDSMSASFIFRPCEIEIPNVFTPNSDGFNDYFFIDGLDSYPNSKLKVYNRWGKVVYRSDNYQNDWDGKNVADGVYYYVLVLMSDARLKDRDGEWNTQFSGTVTILR
ncbi:MAG: T9SS type B sorting domain-containing protein [Bacteroidales bacterium]|jgi:gliding motility-associated-like protein|nr:T9SS type B sorting domain-containing protein [Bacteroidales bacterium]